MSLSQTFSMLALLMLIAFAMVASTLSQFGLTSRLGERASGDALARAAINEFLLRAQYIEGSQSIVGIPPSLLSSFTSQPVLMQPGQAWNCPAGAWQPSSSNLNATATLLLAQCTDNSQGASSVQGVFGEQIPPFGLGIVFQLQSGQHSYTYEALIQQRWPYALAGVGPILLTGGLSGASTFTYYGYASTQPQQQLPLIFYAMPTIINGRVLAMQGSVLAPYATGNTPSPNINIDNAVPDFAQFSDAGVNAVPGANGALQSPLLADRVWVGGPAYVYDFLQVTNPNGNGAAVTGGTYLTPTSGVTVTGAVDLWEDGSTDVGQPSYPNVAVAPGSSTGPVNSSPGSWVTAAGISALLQHPSITGSEAGFFPGNPATAPVTIAPIGPVQNFIINNAGQTQVFQSSVTINNAQLHVAGDLYFSGGSLTGSGATLIVDGTLVLDGTNLSGFPGSGIVIWCRNLLCRASGQIYGMVVAEEGASLYGCPYGNALPNPAPNPLPPPPPLKIYGGLLVGANRTAITAVSNQYQTQLSLTWSSLGLTNVDIEYDAKYLRGLNGHGQFVVTAMNARN